MSAAPYTLFQNPAPHGDEPLYLYSRGRIHDNINRLDSALRNRAFDARIFYAMKSNRFEGVLECVRVSGFCGIDACSPGEVEVALRAGFGEEEISYTGTFLSDSDISFLAAHPGIQVNCDSMSMIRRLARVSAGRSVGIRLNPGIGFGYRGNSLLKYAGSETTKFGIYLEDLRAAWGLAGRLGLSVTGFHFHCGCGYLDDSLDVFEETLKKVAAVVGEFPGLQYLNVGGGLGIPLVEEDKPIDLGRWASLIEKYFGGSGISIWVEPGDYIVKDTGVLILRINTVEKKRDTVFVGVNGGFNIHVEPAFYNLPLRIVPCVVRQGEPRRVTVAGNINEALDIWARDIMLPPVEEGDYLAFFNAGGYGSSMSSNHCCRGIFKERMVDSFIDQ